MKEIKKKRKTTIKPFILETKFNPPVLKENVISRPRLLSSLKKNLNKKLLLITADAGYGKTTLLSQLLEDSKMPFLFYHLEPIDANFSNFLSYLIAGIKKTYPDFGERTKAVLSYLGSSLPDIKMIIGTFINEISALSNKNLFVVLDDYHHLDGYEPINTAVEYLLEHQPRNLHLIISSRTKPSMSLVRLKVKQEMSVLNQNDLRFTKKEVELLFHKTYKIKIDLDEATLIEKKTEGWVTGLQIFSQLLAGERSAEVSNLIARSDPDFFDYFTSEIFLKESLEIRVFLIESSVLDEMFPDVCNYVLGRQNSQDILRTLVVKNLFILTLDNTKTRCRYHQLFREFLNHKLNELETAGKIRDLHLRAATFFEERGYQEKAINHYLQVKEYEKALNIIEDMGEQWLAASRGDVIKRWIDNLPLSLIQQRPLLLNYYAETLVWAGKWDAAMDIYKKARRIARASKDRKSLSLVLTGIAHLFIWRTKYKSAIRVLQKALRITDSKDYLLKTRVLNVISGAYTHLGKHEKALSEVKKAIRAAKKSKDHKLELKVFHDLNVCYFNLGKFDKAIYGFQKIIETELQNPTPLLACTYAYYGMALRIRGLYPEAKEILIKALELQKFFNHTRGILVTTKELGHLHLWIGNYAQAKIYYEEALNLNMEMGITDINSEVLDGLTRLYLYQGNYLRAEQSLNKIFLKKTAFRNPDLMMTKALFESITGYQNKALQTLQKTLVQSKKSSNHLAKMLSLYYLSALFQKKGEKIKWVNYLKKSLRLYKNQQNYEHFLVQAVKQEPQVFIIALAKGVETHVINSVFQEIDKFYDLKIKFLGGLEIKGAGGTIEQKSWKTQKAKSLFCYLMVHQEQRFDRDKLIEHFWPNATLSAGRSNLRSAINFIREAIDNSLIIYEKKTYSINLHWNIWADCAEFEKMLSQSQELVRKGDEQGAVAKCETAFTLYHGDFLPEIYDTWAENLRQFYREKYLEALIRTANYYFVKQDFKEVIDNCGKIIEKDEFQEQAYYLMIQCYLKTGNKKKALNIYNQLSKLLRENFQTEPRLEMNKLFEKGSR